MFSPLQVKFYPSRQAGIYLAGLALLVLFALYQAQLSLLISLIVFAAFCVFPGYWLQRYALLRHSCSVVELRWQAEDKQLKVRLKSGAWLDVGNIEQRIVWPRLSGIRVNLARPAEGSLNLLIFSDSVRQPEQYRQLRVLCRFAKASGAEVTSRN